VPGLASRSLLRRAVVAVDNCRRQGDWDVKLRKLRELGPRWVLSHRSSRGISGHQRSRTVEKNRRSPALRLRQLGCTRAIRIVVPSVDQTRAWARWLVFFAGA
jgi:hypothetical protein